MRAAGGWALLSASMCAAPTATGSEAGGAPYFTC
eukprot:COSAG05_NODE_13251_length_436_cov_7.601869_1_plen_33_part_10